METKKASRVTWKHIVCSIILLVLFVLFTHNNINAEGYSNDTDAISSSDVVPLSSNIFRIVKKAKPADNENEVEAGPKEVVININKVDYYITTYADELEFFSKTFGVSYEDIIDDLHDRYSLRSEEFNENNIGFLTDEDGNVKTFDNVLYGMVEYFYDFVENNPNKKSNKRVPYTGTPEYIENLIIYYTKHIYTNVDTSTALSIGAAESGYYKVKFMLKANNVYGGMSSKGLIKYNNIEYGVLSYVRLLSRRYYGKGLDTIPAIGKVYCPRYDNNGNKIASEHWINLVNSAKKKYDLYNQDLSLNELLNVETA